MDIKTFAAQLAAAPALAPFRRLATATPEAIRAVTEELGWPRWYQSTQAGAAR